MTKLQQQLQSLADSQAQLTKEVAALKQSASSSSTTASPVHPTVAPGTPSLPSAGGGSNSPTGATSQAVELPLSPETLSPATGAVASQVAQGDQQASGLDRQVNALTAEVRQPHHAALLDVCQCAKQVLNKALLYRGL